ncbi:MAG: DUF6915 family protein [Planctomycetota bacterium]
MKREEHARSCEAALGEPFTEVHDFLDRYSQAFPRQHRKLYHHRRGIAVIAERFGPEAARAAEMHILEDEGSIPEDHTHYDADSEELLELVSRTYPPLQE